jgi:hypothetical protein
VRSAIAAALLLLAGCGKVGEPRPPIIRIPQQIDNLSAQQSGYDVVLSWTNPAKYVDGNPAADAGIVHVFRNDLEIMTVPATAPGKTQSLALDASNQLNMPLIFKVQVSVPKASKASPVSNTARIQPVEVPGKPGDIVATVDQGKIVLVWDPPARNRELAEGYLVQRSDKPSPLRVSMPRLEDRDFEPGKSYIYTVTAFRNGPQIVGDGNVTSTVVAKDNNAPAIPAGLEIEILADRVFVSWEKNLELDLKGYELYRSDRTDPIMVGNAEGHYDLDYASGKGISYQVLAVDTFGNKSMKSAAKPGP